MSPHDFNNRRIYLSPAVRFVHLNRTKNFNPSLSLLAQFRLEAGIRVKRTTVFVGGNANTYLTKLYPPLEVAAQLVERKGKINHQIWPGFVFGIQLQSSSPLRDNLGKALQFLVR